jgi:hypothetical protein
MIPMKTSSIFKSRWLALIWAAGILWLAWDVAGGPSADTNSTDSAEATTDATGAPVTPEQEKQFEQALKNL